MTTTAGLAHADTGAARAVALRVLGVLGVAAVAAVATALWLPQFYTATNLNSLLLQASILGIVTLGQALVLLVAGLDLSVAAVMSASLVVVASLSGEGLGGIAVAVLAAVLLGLGVGTLNGVLVAYRGVAPFIVTLGTAALVSGLQLVYTRGAPPGAIPERMRGLTQDGIGVVPWSAVLCVALAVALHVGLRRGTYGRRVYATGTSLGVARRAGVRTDLLLVGIYALCGGLAALAGVVLSSYVGYVDGAAGKGYDLDSVAAAVIGGVAFTGGKGGVLGAALGALALTVVLNVLVLSGIGSHVQLIARGAIIVVALAFIAHRAIKK
ncbi:ABC transporter permease [Nocardioides sp.]|uniref:ABC transporter permease n=1 Tax=Nocardioides sp. TaxID=35761 RepID=UPI0025FBF254|nr:ABC transporter permease [Nocardioides sp.]